MKKTTILIFCSFFNLIDSFVETLTPITPKNYDNAIKTCLTIGPINGICSDSEYGALSD